MPKDQSNRRREIAVLEAACDKTAAALRLARLSVHQLEAKLVARRTELRLQSLLLKRAEDFAALQQRRAVAQLETLPA